MFWWHNAAELVRNDKVNRFGLITTNSIRQTFNRRIVEEQLSSIPPLSIVFAVPDHPWVDTAEGAAVRIAMTVATKGNESGLLLQVAQEEHVTDGSAQVLFLESTGQITANLRTGANLDHMLLLDANQRLSSRGVIPHGDGFVLNEEQAQHLGFGTDESVDDIIKPYRNGKDLTNTSRGVLLIDLSGLTENEVKHRYPSVYQHILTTVKPERDMNPDPARRKNWWLFARSNEQLRQSLTGLSRYIATVQTAKHRFFTFLSGDIMPDDKLIAIGLMDSYFLGVLSSNIHAVFSLAAGSRLGVGNDPVYDKTRCFDPFPFPLCNEADKERIRPICCRRFGKM